MMPDITRFAMPSMPVGAAAAAVSPPGADTGAGTSFATVLTRLSRSSIGRADMAVPIDNVVFEGRSARDRQRSTGPLPVGIALDPISIAGVTDDMASDPAPLASIPSIAGTSSTPAVVAGDGTIRLPDTNPCMLERPAQRIMEAAVPSRPEASVKVDPPSAFVAEAVCATNRTLEAAIPVEPTASSAAAATIPPSADVMPVRDDIADVPVARMSIRAKVFNENGFFSAGGLAAVDRRIAPSATSSQRIAASDLSLARVAHGDPSTFLPIDGSPAPLPGRTVAIAAPSLSSSSRIASIMTAGASPLSAPMSVATFVGATDPTGSGGGVRGDRRVALRRLFAREGAAARTAVSLDAVAQGLRVIVGIDGLVREERARLRDRIAALLSRHGLAAHVIRLDGATAASPEPR